MANVKSANIVDKSKSHNNNKQTLELRKEIEGKLNSTFDFKKVPKSLSQEAKKEYKKLLKKYEQLEVEIWGILDENLLITYCETVVKFRMLNSSYYDEEDEDIKDKLLKKLNEQVKLIALLSDKLCLTPQMRIAAAQKIAKKAVEEKDALEELGF